MISVEVECIVRIDGDGFSTSTYEVRSDRWIGNSAESSQIRWILAPKSKNLALFH